MKDAISPAEAAYFRTLLSLFSAVMVVDRDMQVVFASDTLLRYLPQLADSPLLTDVFELHRPRDLQSYEEFLGRLDALYLMVARDGTFAMRGQVVHGTESGRDHLVFCGAPWLNWMTSNRPEVKLGIKDFSHQDVQLDQLMYMATESNMVADLECLNKELQQAKDELVQAQTARNAFFAQMSHELRTPLNGLVSALALMQRESLQGRAGQLLDLARKSSANMLQVINYVLDIAKLESAELDGETVDFDLGDLVESVIDIVRARAQEKQLDLRVRHNASLPAQFHGDATALRQVLLNLLINAIKFTHEGEVLVDIDVGRSPGMSVRIEVADTGIGIAVERQPYIFDAFAVGGEAPYKLNDGSGLGLEIAKRSIEAMGGQIGLVSEIGVGSHFWVELPLPAAEQTRQTVPQAESPFDTATRFSGRVLLVDDNEINLALMQMILESVGVTVAAASSGAEAVSIAQKGGVDLVLMDISMPDMDGFAATRLIRDFAGADALPVLALTAYTGDDVRTKAEAAGMNGYLAKPLEMEPLSATLALYLDGADAAGGGAESTCVDLETVQTLHRQIGIDSLRTVIDKFADEAGRRWEALTSAETSVDLAREAHTLASTCRSFGLPQVADALAAIEAHAKGGGRLAEVADIDATAEKLQVGIAELSAVIADLQGA